MSGLGGLVWVEGGHEHCVCSPRSWCLAKLHQVPADWIWRFVSLMVVLVVMEGGGEGVGR